MKNEESRIQRDCVVWMRLQWPQYFPVFFSVPNGGNRDAITGAILKAEGAKAGVSDLILLVPRNGYSSLCIEMKKPKGKQSEAQKAFQEAVQKHGNKYVVCHSLEEFRQEINQYLRQ